jgi:hypothetical protein
MNKISEIIHYYSIQNINIKNNNNLYKLGYF